MSETTTQTVEPPRRAAALPTGGKLQPIVPQSVEEIFRLAKGAVQSKFAPESLTKGKDADEATMSVATAMMAGAELGIPPMASLRAFTVINGKPALYGDGIIAVVRRSDAARYIHVGYMGPEEAREEKLERIYNRAIGRGMTQEAATAYMQARNEAMGPVTEDEAFGWCESERMDNGEVHREEFTVAQAKHAGLWQDKPTVTKTGSRGSYEADAGPWYRYRERMLQWRPTGYCMRHLYSDVLGGITDEYEARSTIDITPDEPRQQPARVTAPRAPNLDDIDTGDDETGEIVEGEAGDVVDQTLDKLEPLTLDQVRETLESVTEADELEGAFDALDWQVRLATDEERGEAYGLFKLRLAELGGGGE